MSGPPLTVYTPDSTRPDPTRSDSTRTPHQLSAAVNSLCNSEDPAPDHDRNVLISVKRKGGKGDKGEKVYINPVYITNVCLPSMPECLVEATTKTVTTLEENYSVFAGWFSTVYFLVHLYYS